MQLVVNYSSYQVTNGNYTLYFYLPFCVCSNPVLLQRGRVRIGIHYSAIPLNQSTFRVQTIPSILSSWLFISCLKDRKGSVAVSPLKYAHLQITKL